MADMVDIINRICGDETPLMEAILDLYKQIPSYSTYASIGARFWRCIQMEHDAGHLGQILAEKGKMVPKGKMMRVAGAVFRIYAGKSSATPIVSFNKSVGESPDRVVINIGPYISQYLSEHKLGYNFDYNELAYQILLHYKDTLIKQIDDTLQNNADKQVFADQSMDRIKQMYTTDAFSDE